MSMKNAIAEAKRSNIDIPIGCVITKQGEIVASANNRRERDNDVSAHAEMLAIREAQTVLGTSRLNDCEMFVTLEPCPMCAWTIIQSGIGTLYFGSYNPQYGAAESVLNLPELANSKIKVYGGIMQDECDKILEKFFCEIRKRK